MSARCEISSVRMNDALASRVLLSLCLATVQCGPDDTPPKPQYALYTLSVSKQGSGTGTIVSEPPGIECGTQCSATFSSNDRVKLVVRPDNNMMLVAWTVESDRCGTHQICTNLCIGRVPCELTLDGPTRVDARLGPRCTPDGWCIETPILTRPPPVFTSVWGTSSTDVWAANYNGMSFIHWDGTAWTEASAMAPRGRIRMWGSESMGIWAIGDEVFHWDGSAWSFTNVGAQHIWAIWGSGSEDLWATGDAGLLMHWDGKAWTRVPSGTDKPLYAIWGSGPQDVWVVGGDLLDGLILHWDGSRWSLNSGSVFAASSIWGSGPRDVWASGFGDTLHWDGVRWLGTDLDGISNQIWGTGPNDVWSVNTIPLWHWDGSVWQKEDLKKNFDRGYDDNFYLARVWGTDPGNIWIVGSEIFHYRSKSAM